MTLMVFACLDSVQSLSCCVDFVSTINFVQLMFDPILFGKTQFRFQRAPFVSLSEMAHSGSADMPTAEQLSQVKEILRSLRSSGQRRELLTEDAVWDCDMLLIGFWHESPDPSVPADTIGF